MVLLAMPQSATFTLRLLPLFVTSLHQFYQSLYHAIELAQAAEIEAGRRRQALDIAERMLTAGFKH